MEGLTFDAGALIALERRKQRMAQVLAVARLKNIPITIPAAVLAEWWRGQSSGIKAMLRAATIEPVTEALALSAGEALAVTKGANAVDALVMASAAARGDIVYTSDVRDLTALQAVFPGVRVLRC
jgi:predicted nucleic acid-binding protein